MPNAIELSGQRFGRLSVLSRAPARGRDTHWLCNCDCGNQKIASTAKLRCGDTSSCGCLRREKAGASLRTHGATNTLTWKRWRSMVNRCTMVNAKNYPRYGGRGIRICERWQQFESFLSDMGACPSDAHTLDRFPDNDGNYELSNCRWAVDLQQKRNHSAIRWLTFQGEKLCAAEWSARLGLHLRTIYGRMNKGWSDERVLTTTVKPHLPRRR